MPLSLFSYGAMALVDWFTPPFGLTILLLLLLIRFMTDGARTIKKTPDEHGRILTLDASLASMDVFLDAARPRCCVGWMIATLHAAVLMVQRKDLAVSVATASVVGGLNRVTAQESEVESTVFPTRQAHHGRDFLAMGTRVSIPMGLCSFLFLW